MVTPEQRQRRPASGFALVDVIVASVLLGIALVVIIGQSGHAITSQARGRDLQLAAMLADEQLNLVLARGPDDYPRRFPVDGPCDPPFEAFHYLIDLSGGSATEPYHVTATISWSSGSTPQSLVIETLIAAREAGGEDADPPRQPQSTVSRPQ